MSWLEDTQNHRRLQAERMQKAFGYDGSEDLRKADNDMDFSETKTDKNKKKRNGKSDMYKMRLLGLRKFNEQDQKIYLGVEDTDNSYITNLDNGDIVISKTTDGYLVSKFPIDEENEEGEEKEATALSEAIDVALQYKDDLDNAKAPEQIMYKETTEKASTDDEVNPFEVAAWEAEHNDVAKAYAMLGLDDEFEKAKHQDGDMHPNGKWVWRQSANGGKGDWRVAKPGGSKATAGGGAATAKKELKGIALKREYEKIKSENEGSYDGVTIILYKKPKDKNGDLDYDYEPKDGGDINQEEIGYFDTKKEVDEYIRENNLVKNRYFIAYEAYLNNKNGDYIENACGTTAASAKESLMSILVNGYYPSKYKNK